MVSGTGDTIPAVSGTSDSDCDSLPTSVSRLTSRDVTNTDSENVSNRRSLLRSSVNEEIVGGDVSGM